MEEDEKKYLGRRNNLIPDFNKLSFSSLFLFGQGTHTHTFEEKSRLLMGARCRRSNRVQANGENLLHTRAREHIHPDGGAKGPTFVRTELLQRQA